jgi:hypothetical protein
MEVFAVFVRKHGTPQITLPEIRPISDYKCTGYNTTSAWRIAAYIDITDSPKNDKLCTC